MEFSLFSLHYFSLNLSTPTIYFLHIPPNANYFGERKKILLMYIHQVQNTSNGWICSNAPLDFPTIVVTRVTDSIS